MKNAQHKKTFSKLALAALIAGSLAFAPTAQAVEGSIQGMGSWWDAGDSGSTYGFGLRGTLEFMEGLGIDLGWTYFGEGDDMTLRLPGKNDDINFGGIDANVFDLGMRYTFPAEIYLGGGLSYFDLGHDIASIDGEWGLYGLVGWSFGGEHLRGFIEGVYRYTEGTIKYNHGFEGHIDRDLEYDGFGANVGVMYRF